MTESALILGYKRNLGVVRTIESCHTYGIQRIYLSLDGVDSQSEKHLQAAIIANASSYCLEHNISLFINQNREHIGLRKAVLQGVDWYFSNESFGFIFEDDLEVSQDFFRFADYFLKQDLDPRILLISGNSIADSKGSMLVNYPLIWGWATTSLKWEKIRELITENTLSLKAQSPGVPLKVRCFWLAGCLSVNFGIVDSWAISLARGMRLGGYTSVVPPCNLVSNHGSDTSATHTTNQSAGLNQAIQTLRSFEYQDLITTPQSISKNNAYLEMNVYKITSRNYFSPLLTLVKRLFKSLNSVLNFLNFSSTKKPNL